MTGDSYTFILQLRNLQNVHTYLQLTAMLSMRLLHALTTLPLPPKRPGQIPDNPDHTNNLLLTCQAAITHLQLVALLEASSKAVHGGHDPHPFHQHLGVLLRHVSQQSQLHVLHPPAVVCLVYHVAEGPGPVVGHDGSLGGAVA